MVLLIGHPEMINFATSFWAGFASHPSRRLHTTTPGLAPQTHKWTQVPLAGSDSEHLRWRFCLSLSLGTVSLFTPSLLKKTGPAIASDQCREAEAPPSEAGNESRGRKGEIHMREMMALTMHVSQRCAVSWDDLPSLTQGRENTLTCTHGHRERLAVAPQGNSSVS